MQPKIKILIVDDDPDISFFLKQSLGRSGKYKVLAARGAKAGLWLATCRWHKPHLILLDIMMPGIDGFEALRKLKIDKATMHIPVVMCSALGDLPSKIKAEGLACDDYIVKPASLDDIKRKVEEVLARHGMASQP